MFFIIHAIAVEKRTKMYSITCLLFQPTLVMFATLLAVPKAWPIYWLDYGSANPIAPRSMVSNS